MGYPDITYHEDGSRTVHSHRAFGGDRLEHRHVILRDYKVDNGLGTGQNYAPGDFIWLGMSDASDLARWGIVADPYAGAVPEGFKAGLGEWGDLGKLDMDGFETGERYAAR